MQVSILNRSHFKFLLSATLMVMGCFQTYASTISNVDELEINAPIDTSYPVENQDLNSEEIPLMNKDLNINSNDASITNLNNGRTVFTFSGNVEIISEIVIIKCDKAVLEFDQHELTTTRFIGELSSFQQFDDEKEMIASGTAEVFEYDHITNVLRMENNAWVNNGSNEVTGNLITYNLVKRNIIADSENGSPVKLIIESATIN